MFFILLVMDFEVLPKFKIQNEKQFDDQDK